eukprot:gnl/TRDRNA2_/TRDRNA2_72833_c2_seq1.p2 gnl/TRDRNA2_/TRDRNA2_72833_c2~~gnl/TRDRNA2_/TRDRNA2_72833_c2_seq1.p2  ORF type:complete len:108 (-),score=1.41 gnl/TRDRNA2_/TRDRNA2_72833_c2_seq1:64-387(-)
MVLPFCSLPHTHSHRECGTRKIGHRSASVRGMVGSKCGGIEEMVKVEACLRGNLRQCMFGNTVCHEDWDPTKISLTSKAASQIRAKSSVIGDGSSFATNVEQNSWAT